ncbi:MAG: SDR family NAD(P)-dependent oxidoreductase [Planctomycetaceae bacterium]|jgi:3-oxoacyl-[acyl-carrier protein] reductase|nr:SDR family NAD(P)-dependent oxidoreductase [Planctomycetaceae bacterium]
MKRILTGSKVIITGASSGIGAALVGELAKEGVDMVITARRGDRLNEIVAKIQDDYNDYSPTNGIKKIISVVGDITDEAVRGQIIETVRDKLGGLDILINNAGVGATSLIEATKRDTLRWIFEVNFFSLFEMTQLAIPLLKESAASEVNKKLKIYPMIINLSSIVGLRGVPHYGVYGAAKFAVNGLSETMRAELKQHGIDVLTVCPGTTATEFFDVLYQSSSAPSMPIHTAVTPEYVAGRIVNAMKRGKHKIIPYFQAVILDYLNRFFPRFTDWIMTKYV